MKNIMLIVPSLKGRGAERVVSVLSKGFSEKYNVIIVVFDSEDIAYSYNGKLINLNLKSEPNFHKKILNVFKRASKIKQIKMKYNIHFSISFLDGANIVNILSRSNEKIITTVHSSYISKSTLNKHLIKLLYNKSDKVIGVSKGIADKLVRKYNIIPSKVGHIYNPVDFTEIQKTSNVSDLDSLKKNSNKFILTTMGSLSKPKGHWHLIRAISEVKKTIPEIELNILGEGPLEGYLNNLIVKMNLQGNINLLGYKNNPFDIIKKSDLFILTSLYEGFSNVLVESMSSGTPVVATDCQFGPREILAPSTDFRYQTDTIELSQYGILTPNFDGVQYGPDDPLTSSELGLAKLIIKLSRNKDILKKYSKVGLKRSKEFDISSVIQEWDNLLMSI